MSFTRTAHDLQGSQFFYLVLAQSQVLSLPCLSEVGADLIVIFVDIIVLVIILIIVILVRLPRVPLDRVGDYASADRLPGIRTFVFNFKADIILKKHQEDPYVIRSQDAGSTK